MTAQSRVPVVRTAAGTIEIGTAPRPGHGHVVAVFGGLVSIDLERPTDMPSASIDDVAQAAWWLSLVYGDEVAAAVAELGVPGDDSDHDAAEAPDVEPEQREVGLDPGPLADCLARYARLDWLHWAWPSSDGALAVRADETAFDVELGVLAARLQFVLGGPHVAAGLLAPRVEEVLAESADGSSADLALLRPALRAIAEAVPLDDADHDRVMVEEARADEVARGAQVLSDAALAAFMDSRARSDAFRPQAELAARGDGRRRGSRGGPDGVRSETFGVDRRQVPRRALSAAADAVELSIRPRRSSTSLEVVVGVGDRPTERPLSALVYLDADDLPTVVIPLQRSRAGVYAGAAEVDRTASEFHVEIVDPSIMGRPDPEGWSQVEDATLPLFERALDEARQPLDATPVDELPPTAPVRALVPGAIRRG